MRHKNIFIVMMIMFVLFGKHVFAWDKDIVHPLINKKAAEQSNLNSYLSGQLPLEFPNGISQTVNEKSVKTWIEEGGREEDESIFPLIGYLLRSSKHFHDPTKTWDEAGWSGWWGTSLSSIYWAQSSSNEWSWQKAREYYLQALTGTTKTERGKKYGNTFEALGHVIHLVADTAVPEHTRNDTHVFKKTVEGWAYEHSGELNTSATTVNTSIFQQSHVSGLAPIINLWDTYPYAGYNPNGPIGLAEYSNYNFLSHDTVFKDYEYPGMTNTFLGEPSERTAEDGTNDNLIYYSGATSDGISIPHLASTTYLFSEISELSQDKYHLKATLDDECFKDYASILIPRAVGYSASLINYFFRGQINMEKDPNNSSLYVIKNESDEYMSGTLSLYYDNTSDNRKFITSWDRSINANSSSDPVTFTAPTDAKEKGKYILVFQGTLGNETDDAVVGRVVKVEECIKPEEVEIIYENGILQMKDCEGKWKSIYTVGCIPSEEPIQAVKKRDNTSSFVVTGWYQNYRMYIVEVTDEIENKDGLLFRKLNCSLSGNYIGSSDTRTDEYSSDITSSGGYGLVDITISYTSTSNSTGSISYSVTRKANGEWSFIQTTKGISSSTSYTTRILKTPVLDAPQSWYDETLMWYYPGDGYGESAKSCLYKTPIRCYFRIEGLGEFYSAILGSPSASETETGKQMIGGSTSIDLFTGETISYTAPSETSSCRNREVGEARPPLYNNFGSYLPNDIQSEQFCDWTTCPSSTVWTSIPGYIGGAVYWDYSRYLKLSDEDKKRITIQYYGKIISSMMGDQYRYNDPRRVPWQNCP